MEQGAEPHVGGSLELGWGGLAWELRAAQHEAWRSESPSWGKAKGKPNRQNKKGPGQRAQTRCEATGLSKSIQENQAIGALNVVTGALMGVG